MKSSNRNLLIVALISLVNGLSVAVIVPVIYVYSLSFGLDDVGAALLVTLFSLSQFIATPVIGRLSDYFGRRPLLVISLFGTALSNLLAASAGTAWVLFAARILDGITGGNNSVAQAVISDTTEPKDRAKGFALFGAAFGIAFIIGPVLSIFAQRISLNTPFLVSTVFALIAAFLTWFVLPETLKKKETTKFAIGNLGFGQIFTSLKIPVINSLLVINFFYSLIFGVFTFAFQPLVINKYNFGTQEISLVLVVYGLISAAMQVFAIPKLTKRFALTSLLFMSILGTGLVLALMLIDSQVIFWLTVILFPIFFAVSRPIITALISINSKAEDQGVVIGVSESYFSLANSIGPLIGGVLLSVSLESPIIAAIVFAAVALYVLVAKRSRINTPLKEKANF